MDVIDKLLAFAERHGGVSGRRVTVASLPIVALLSYFAIFEALHGLELFGTIWAHAITLCLIAGTAWLLLAPRLLAAIDRRRSASVWTFAVLGLGFAGVALVEPQALLGRLMIAMLLVSIVILAPGSGPGAAATPIGQGARRTPRSGWLRHGAAAARRHAAHLISPARIVAGTLMITLLTLSLPEGVTWMKTPSPTADDKIGVWVAEFEGDEADDTQRSLMTTIESVVFEDSALAQLVEIKALPQVIAIEGPRAEQHRAAEEALAGVKASLLIFGTYSKAQANVYTAVAPEYVAFSPLFLIPIFPELRIDRSDQVGAVYAVAKYITGVIYLFDKNDCTHAGRQFQAALDRAEGIASLKDVTLLDDIRVAVAQSVACAAARGLANAEQLRDSIATLERIASNATTPTGDGPPAGDQAQRQAIVAIKALVALGYAYRQLARFQGEPVAADLGRAVSAYRQGLTALARLPESRALPAAPLLEPLISSNLGVAFEKLSEQSDRAANLVRAIAQYVQADALLCKEAVTSRNLALACASIENNLGVALQKLAEAGIEPVAKLKQAIDAYAGAIARLSRTAPEERASYALYSSNLAQSYWLLAAQEERDANLRLARQAIEDGLAVSRATEDPDTFAEIMYKLGQIETAEAAGSPDGSRGRAAIADWACSLVVFDRLHQIRAAVVVEALDAVRKRLGDAAFVQAIGTHEPAAECPYAPEDIPRLMAANRG